MIAGLLDRVDVAAQVQSAYNRKGGEEALVLGDASLRVGFQAVVGEDAGWLPDVLVTVKETFPTGPYERLALPRLGTDAGGSGAYTTTAGINVQKVIRVTPRHVLRFRINASYALPARVHVAGLSSYGGGEESQGTVAPGRSLAVVLAAEYHVTAHWVVALDAMHVHRDEDTFTSDTGARGAAMAPRVGSPPGEQTSLAPALAYTLSGNVGFLAGVWLTLCGRNDAAFVSPVFSVTLLL